MSSRVGLAVVVALLVGALPATVEAQSRARRMAAAAAAAEANRERSGADKAPVPKGPPVFEPDAAIHPASPYSQLGRGLDWDANVLGTADVFGHGPYDLFLFPNRLCPFQEFADDGSPVYGTPIELNAKTIGGDIITGPDGTIYLVSGARRKLVVSVFDRQTLAFDTLAQSPELDIPGGIGGGIGARLDAEGRLDVYFTIGDGTEYRPKGDHHHASYVPYNGAGFWRGGIPRLMLYHVRFASLALESVERVGRAGHGPGEFLFSVRSLTVASLGEDRPPLLISSEKLGVLRYFPIDPETGLPGPQQFVNSEEQVALRHDVINTSVKVIADPETGLSNLLVGDTGRVWFYKFSGRFADNGSPIYLPPRPVMAEGMFLSLGELAAITAGDMDGDGLVDLMVGNDAGQLLFVRNVGSAERAQFAPAAVVPVGGRPLDIKAGYRGSIQGPGEAMWGYTNPTACDWSGDGRIDIVMNSVLGDFLLIEQIPADEGIAFAEPKWMYCDGLQLHLAWRHQPAVTDWGIAGGRLCLLALDERNQLRRFWRIDKYNVERGELLRYEDGTPITSNIDESAGQTGRANFVPFDWDRDGRLDLLIGTSRGLSFHASPTVFYPSDAYPNHQASVLFLRNIGTNEDPVFDYVRYVQLDGRPIGLGIHSVSPVPLDVGRGVTDLLVSEENGTIQYYPFELLSISEPAE